MKVQNQNDQVTPSETAEILRLAEQCLQLDGDFVELGCYRGDTSVLLGKLLAKASLETARNSQQPAGNLCKTCGKPAKSCVKLEQNSSKTVNNLCKISTKQCKTCGNQVENCQESVQNSVDKPVGKRLWIYDSFAGLPEKTTEDHSGAGRNFQKGELAVTKREVVDKIRRAGLHNVVIKKAWFDELTDRDLPEKIAFAFLDGDLYGSIKTSLKLVIPRLEKSGIVIVHDYNNPELPGSSRAVDEFLRTHPSYRLTVRHTLAIISQS